MHLFALHATEDAIDNVLDQTGSAHGNVNSLVRSGHANKGEGKDMAEVENLEPLATDELKCGKEEAAVDTQRNHSDQVGAVLVPLSRHFLVKGMQQHGADKKIRHPAMILHHSFKADSREICENVHTRNNKHHNAQCDEDAEGVRKKKHDEDDVCGNDNKFDEVDINHIGAEGSQKRHRQVWMCKPAAHSIAEAQIASQLQVFCRRRRWCRPICGGRVWGGRYLVGRHLSCNVPCGHVLNLCLRALDVKNSSSDRHISHMNSCALAATRSVKIQMAQRVPSAHQTRAGFCHRLKMSIPCTLR
eukprot:Opistho-2@1264